MNLKDRMAVVTGAGSGIGRAIALALAARGAAVAAVDLDVASAQETAGLIASAGGRAEPFQCDTSKGVDDRPRGDGRRPRRSVRSRSWSTMPASSTATSTSTRWTRRLWRRVIDIDLTGVFLGCKRALAEMLPRGRGRIVNMASVAGLNGTGWRRGVRRGQARRGRAHATDGRRLLLARRDDQRRVPGPILTNLRQHSQEILGPDIPDMSGRGIAVSDEQVRAVVPAGRRGTVEDIASAVCYLASDEAGYITGHAMVVDGGWRAK